MTAPARAAAATPSIIVSERQPNDVVNDALAVLVAANEPPALYMRSGTPVRVTDDEDGRPTIRDAAPETLLERLYEAATWYRKDRRGNFVDGPPPRGLAIDVRERLRAQAHRLPPLRGVVQSPLIRRDGSILDTPGYDPATRLVYAPPAGFAMPPVPGTVTSTDVELATAALEEVFLDFPFVDEADRASAWALLFSIVLREHLGNVPLIVFTAPSQGTGKGLLVDALSTIATGQRAAISSMPDPRSDEEMRKRVTTILRAGRAVAVLDNVMRPIDSPALAALLTADRWTDRLLGVNEEVDLPNRSVWIATGNNVSVRGDFARRTVWCRLDARVARPWLREGFRHPDLLAWVTAQRGELLGALLTLARAWVQAGRPGPAEETPPLGGFEGWRHVVGGVLGMIGVSDLLGQAATMYDEADEETPAWSAFLSAWAERWGERPVAVAELVRVLRAESEGPSPTALAQTIPPELAGALDGKTRAGVRVGTALKKHAGKRFPGADGTVWIERAGADSHSKVSRWRVRCG